MPRLSKSKTEAVLHKLSEIAELGATAQLEILRSGTNPTNGKPLSPMELNVLTGTAIDKIAKYERWDSAGQGETGEWVQRLAAGLKQIGGGSVTLTVEPLPEKQPEPRTIEAEVLPR